MNFIKTCLDDSVQPNKIKLLFNDVLKTTDKVIDQSPKDINVKITLDRFLHSKAPIEQVQENIKILPQVLEGLIGKAKEFDVVDFLTKNVNMK